MNEMVGLLRELVEEVQELQKITQGVSGLGVQIYQQNAKLVRLGERQSYLAEKASKGGLGLGLGLGAEKSESEGVKKDKGKGKASEVVEETMKSDGGSDSEEGSEKDMREDSDVGGSGMDLDKEK
jgi:hypothetical protein